MLYHLHFDETNCPYGDDALTEDVFIHASKNLDVDKLFEEVDTLKSQMDNAWSGIENDENFNVDQSNPLYDEYCDYGWNEKISEAIKLVAKQHPEWEIEIVKIQTYNTLIN